MVITYQHKGYYLSTSGSTPRDIRTSTIFFITAACLHGWTEACFPANKWGWSSIVTCAKILCYVIASRQPVLQSNRRQLHCFTGAKEKWDLLVILNNHLKWYVVDGCLKIHEAILRVQLFAASDSIITVVLIFHMLISMFTIRLRVSNLLC